jgi:hypothetical protein
MLNSKSVFAAIAAPSFPEATLEPDQIGVNPGGLQAEALPNVEMAMIEEAGPGQSGLKLDAPTASQFGELPAAGSRT